MTEALFLSSKQVRDLATPSDYVQAVEAGYRAHGDGGSARPRDRLSRSNPWGMLTGYTAILPGLGAMGGYTYSAGFGRKDAWFLVSLFDADTGELLALLDGAALNPLKTGAAGAVAVDHLARQDASTLALIGSGRQAWGQLVTAAQVRDLDEVRVHSPTKTHRESFAEAAGDRLGTDVRPTDTPAAAVDGAGIVITATRATEPVFQDEDLADGTHVTAMGQYHPERREIPGPTVARALYVPDLEDRARQDSGELLMAIEEGLIDEDHVHAELGRIVAGDRPGRSSQDQVTLFDSGGTGIETVAAAKMLYDRARDAGIGSPVPFEPASQGMEDIRRS